eukprot:scaffold27543_cov101-Isochrysis_galbana.AAC.3
MPGGEGWDEGHAAPALPAAWSRRLKRAPRPPGSSRQSCRSARARRRGCGRSGCRRATEGPGTALRIPRHAHAAGTRWAERTRQPPCCLGKSERRAAAGARPGRRPQGATAHPTPPNLGGRDVWGTGCVGDG